MLLRRYGEICTAVLSVRQIGEVAYIPGAIQDGQKRFPKGQIAFHHPVGGGPGCIRNWIQPPDAETGPAAMWEGHGAQSPSLAPTVLAFFSTHMFQVTSSGFTRMEFHGR